MRVAARARQIEELRQSDLFANVRVSDYLFAKDQLFADLNLSPDELSLYRQVVESLNVEAPVPDQSEVVVMPTLSEQQPAQVPAQPARTQTAEAVGTAPAKGSYVVQLGSFTSTEGSEQALSLIHI